MSLVLQNAYDHVIANLCHLERIFGDKFKLTFLARYTSTDLDDADILVTSDDLGLVLAAVQRRVDKAKE